MAILYGSAAMSIIIHPSIFLRVFRFRIKMGLCDSSDAQHFGQIGVNYGNIVYVVLSMCTSIFFQSNIWIINKTSGNTSSRNEIKAENVT